MELENNAENIIINSKGSGNGDTDLLNLQKLMNDDKIESSGVFKDIQTQIQEYNDDPKRRNLMRTAELRMKEETAVAEKRGIEIGEKRGVEIGREKGDKNTVRVFKVLKPDATVTEGLAWIKANTDVSLSDEEIKAILSENN
ncbi:hypothetical protein FC23_GL000631 [Lactobacillus psittaci DSM 15354]|uniref:Transposase n=1 Tax=Lactobacillus psittaci DSM 15354 TaxID=1122152 RepID=A0A0R1S248_9LACO|nr:hypothetical protein FC23_GL000631 [Lactobacillus psittaci DSM 15354]